MHGWFKHVEDSNKYIIEKIVRQVAHLPELYEDARLLETCTGFK
jgi:hypothetical protein